MWLDGQPELAEARRASAFSPEDLARLAPPSACCADLPTPPHLPPSHLGFKSGKARRARKNRIRKPHEPRQPAVKASPGLERSDQLDFASAVDVLTSFPRVQFLLAVGKLDFLFFGRAGIARDMVKRGAPWVLTFEIERVRKKTWTGVRLTAAPARIAWTCGKGFRKVIVGNCQASWVGSCVVEFEGAGGEAFWIENPDGSLFGSIPPRGSLKARAARRLFAVSSAILASLGGGGPSSPSMLAWLEFRQRANARLLTSCSGAALAHGMAWTRVAQTYPKQLAAEVATSVVVKVGWSSRNSCIWRALCLHCSLPERTCWRGLPSWTSPS